MLSRRSDLLDHFDEVHFDQIYQTATTARYIACNSVYALHAPLSTVEGIHTPYEALHSIKYMQTSKQEASAPIKWAENYAELGNSFPCQKDAGRSRITA